jgi:hypothetical protein
MVDRWHKICMYFNHISFLIRKGQTDLLLLNPSDKNSFMAKKLKTCSFSVEIFILEIE